MGFTHVQRPRGNIWLCLTLDSSRVLGWHNDEATTENRFQTLHLFAQSVAPLNFSFLLSRELKGHRDFLWLIIFWQNKNYIPPCATDYEAEKCIHCPISESWAAFWPETQNNWNYRYRCFTGDQSAAACSPWKSQLATKHCPPVHTERRRRRGKME